MLGTNLVGWEWDAIARGGPHERFVAAAPPGVLRLAESDPAARPRDPDSELEYLVDDGRTYSRTAPPDQGSAVQAVTWRHASGARVFAAGSIQWPWGLGPYFPVWTAGPGRPARTYADLPLEPSHGLGALRHATRNLLEEAGVHAVRPADDDAEGPVASGPPEVTGAKPAAARRRVVD